MDIVISRSKILDNITGKPRKYCLECSQYFDPSPLAWDSHATHYSWFLPEKPEEFDGWVEHVREKSENVWGYIMDEDGTESRPFCPSAFTLQITD